MPLTPEQRSQINKSNSLKSTGPSAAGKLRSRSNALKHGLRAKVLALPNEDPAVVAGRTEAWNEFYQPKSPAAQHLVNQCVHATLLADRCEQFHAAQLDRQIREAPFDRTNSRVDDLHRLDALLTKDPARAVGELRRTAHGCRWMIERWQHLASKLEDGQSWEQTDLCDAIYLNGRLPHVWAVDPDVHRVSLYAMLMSPEPPTAQIERYLNKELLSPSVIDQVLCDIPLDKTECRRRLREIVESELQSLRDDERTLREQLEDPSDALLAERSLILADPQAARLFLRYRAEARSAFHRSYSELIRTLKRDAEAGVTLENVDEASCSDVMTAGCDQTSTRVAELAIESGPAEVVPVPPVAPQVHTNGSVARKTPNEARETAADPHFSRYLRDLDMLQCHAAAHADRVAAKIGRKRRGRWNWRQDLAQGVVDMKPHVGRGAILWRAGSSPTLSGGWPPLTLPSPSGIGCSTSPLPEGEDGRRPGEGAPVCTGASARMKRPCLEAKRVWKFPTRLPSLTPSPDLESSSSPRNFRAIGSCATIGV